MPFVLLHSGLHLCPCCSLLPFCPLLGLSPQVAGLSEDGELAGRCERRLGEQVISFQPLSTCGCGIRMAPGRQLLPVNWAAGWHYTQTELTLGHPDGCNQGLCHVALDDPDTMRTVDLGPWTLDLTVVFSFGG